MEVYLFLHTLNHDIYNFEPGGIKEYFSDRWRTIDDIKNIKFKFDLIYGSHSLEHVQDIKKHCHNLKDCQMIIRYFSLKFPTAQKKKYLLSLLTYYFNTDFL